MEEANTDVTMESLFVDEKTEITTEVLEPSPDDDFEYAKRNIRSAIEKGNIALAELLEIARDSGHPRAFEVFTTLMSSIVTANKDLIEAKETAQKIEDNGSQSKTINNNVFLTTSQLAKILEKHIPKN